MESTNKKAPQNAIQDDFWGNAGTEFMQSQPKKPTERSSRQTSAKNNTVSETDMSWGDWGGDSKDGKYNISTKSNI